MRIGDVSGPELTAVTRIIIYALQNETAIRFLGQPFICPFLILAEFFGTRLEIYDDL